MDHQSSDPGAFGDDAASQRAASRDSLFLAAQLRLGNTPAITVRVRNLSPGGLMAELPGLATVGERLMIEVRGVGWVPGSIAWILDNRAGIAFDRPIDPLAARKPVGQGAATPSYVKPVLTRR